MRCCMLIYVLTVVHVANWSIERLVGLAFSLLYVLGEEISYVLNIHFYNIITQYTHMVFHVSECNTLINVFV